MKIISIVLILVVMSCKAKAQQLPDSVSISTVHEIIDYNLHMLDELEPLLQKKGDATSRLLVQIKTNTAWFKTQLLLTDLKLTEVTLDLRATKMELKREKRKNVWRTIGAGAGGIAVGVIIITLAAP